MNFIFLSPNFPEQYFNFCAGLKANGVTTLGIGDCPYDQLVPQLKDALNEYYKVGNLENYDEVYRAVAYFAFKYGRIDWLESNNEYWLERDAKLRDDFNINTGIKSDKIEGIKYKSKMKEFYNKAGVPVAHYQLLSTLEKALTFTKDFGYPVIIKPDNGVGASATYKIKSDEELIKFFDTKDEKVYIMEEFIDGLLISYDGICDSNRDIIFETCNFYPDPILDVVTEQKDVWFYSKKIIPENIVKAGRSVVKTFETQSRFFHCEFFVLNNDKPGVGKKGDVVGLEVNMRPPGGYIPDMMNYANDISVYQIWANMVTYDEGRFDKEKRPYTCGYIARRDAHSYAHTMEEVRQLYGSNIRVEVRLPELFKEAMGDDMVLACFTEEKEMLEFVDYALKAA